eukprot:1393591-Amorphochlora_amoeboformis.AAC.1
MSSSQLHLHFGAGKLGLGLLLKSIEANCTDYAVVQRPSKSWASVLESEVKAVRVRVNGEQVGKPMTLLHGSRWASRVAPGQGPYFIAASGGKALVDVVRKARSFSCSLHKGLAGLKAILGRLPVRSDPPRLYACENDHAAVEDLAHALEGRVLVVPCMVDRICSSRLIYSNGTVEVKTEPWEGQIVVLPAHKSTGNVHTGNMLPPHTATDIDRETTDTTTDAEESDVRAPGLRRKLFGLTSETEPPSEEEDEEEDEPKEADHPLPFGGTMVVTTDTEEQAKYFARRKILLVNGTHTTLAFLTLIKEMSHQDVPDKLSRMELPGRYALLDYERADTSARQKVWAWLVARCYIVSTEFDSEVLTGAHNTTSEEEAFKMLLDYAWTTLQRFSHVPDTTGRVLSGGVVKRYNGRLKNVLDTITDLEKEGKSSPIDILRAATRIGRPEVTRNIMMQSLREIVREATPIMEEKALREARDKTFRSPSIVNPAKKYEFLTMLRRAFVGGAK